MKNRKLTIYTPNPMQDHLLHALKIKEDHVALLREKGEKMITLDHCNLYLFCDGGVSHFFLTCCKF